MNERLISLEELATPRPATAPARQPLQGRRLVVIGKRSYLGGSFAAYAAAQGAEVVAVSSEDCDFADRQAVLRFFRALGQDEWTIVFAAVVKKAQASFDAFIRNITLVRHLIEGCRQARIGSMIYLSSVDVYGRRPSLPITEQTRLSPDSWYALAKVVSEWMLLASGEVQCPMAVLRLPGIYGRAPNDQSVIGRLIGQIRRDRRVVLRGCGQWRRDYVFVEDLCRVIEHLVPVRYQGIVNVATGQSRSLAEIVELLRRTLGVEFDIAHEPEEQARAFDLVFDPGRLQALVPAVTFRSLEQGLQAYVGPETMSRGP